jgi:hypothetical protein
MELQQEIEKLFRPLIAQRTWGAKVGWGSFVTLEFGARHLRDHHYHGDWHLWLYQCDWTLRSENHEMANSESKRGVMQTAIDNLEGLKLTHVSFDQDRMATEFVFDENLRMRCQSYPDAPPDEECWMLFMPDEQVATLQPSGLTFEPASEAVQTADIEVNPPRGKRVFLEE